MEKIKIFAPATIANLVCGFDVIGLALNNPSDEILLKRSNKSGISILKIDGADFPLDTNKNVCLVSLQEFINECPYPIGFEIEILKKIKPGSGIGSSAASSAGVVAGANILLGNPFSTLELIRFAMEGERLVSGRGGNHADNVAPVLMGGITLIRSYNPLDIANIHVPNDLWISVIHPSIEIKTSEARKILKKKVFMKDAIKQCGNFGSFIAGLYQVNYDLISRSLEDVMVEPIRGMLIPSFYQVKAKCKEVGALGGGISGSGPSIFMLSKGEKTAYIVSSVMEGIYDSLKIEYQVYTSSINQKGLKWYEI